MLDINISYLILYSYGICLKFGSYTVDAEIFHIDH